MALSPQLMPVPAQARHFSESRGQKSVTFSLDNIAYPRGFKVGKFSVFEQQEGGRLYFSITVWLWAGAFFSAFNCDGESGGRRNYVL